MFFFSFLLRPWLCFAKVIYLFKVVSFFFLLCLLLFFVNVLCLFGCNIYFVSLGWFCRCYMPLKYFSYLSVCSLVLLLFYESLDVFFLFFCVNNFVLSMFYTSLNLFFFSFVSVALFCQCYMPLWMYIVLFFCDYGFVLSIFVASLFCIFFFSFVSVLLFC